MTKIRRSTAGTDTTGEPTGADLPPERSSRLGWFLPRLGVMLALLAVVAWFAPLILAKSGYWRSVLAVAAPQWQGRIDARSVSLGWLSPVVVEGAVVRDAEGNELLAAGRVSSERTLWGLAMSSADLGKFTVAEPTAAIVVRADGSNVEDFLATLPAGGGETPRFALDVVDGDVTVADEVTGAIWRTQGLRALVDWSSADARQGSISAAIGPADDSENAAVKTGELLAEFSAQDDQFTSGSAKLALRDVPTEALSSVLRRLNVDVQMAGPVSAEVDVAWSDAGRQCDIACRSLQAPQLVVASNRYLSGDQLRIASLVGGGEASLRDNRLTLRNVKLDSDVAQLRGEGEALLAQATQSPSSLAIEARVDLARLAQQLPRALRLRSDTRITSGLLSVSLENRSDGGTQRWQGTVRTDNLVAETAGRRVDWPQPATLEATLVLARNGWSIERLHGNASFLELTGSGSLDGGTITASADLNRLVADFAQVVDWQGLQLSGNLQGELRWNRQPDDQWQATGSAAVRNFQLNAPGRMPWREDDLQINGVLQGRVAGTTLEQLTSGQLGVVSGQDRLDAELAEPIANPSFRSAWPVRYAAQGDVGSWMARMQAVVPSITSRPEGTFQWKGSGRVSTNVVELGPNVLDVRGLQIDVADMAIREPELHLETEGSLDLAERKFTSRATTLAGTAVALRAENVVVGFGERLVVSGNVDYRGDLARISTWLAQAGQPPTWQVGGALTGSAEARFQDGIVQAKWRTDVENLSYATSAESSSPSSLVQTSSAASRLQTQWTEPRVTLQGSGQYNPQQDALRLTGANLTATALSLTLNGSLTEMRARSIADLRGELRYDGQSVSEKLRPMFGETFQMVGQEQRQFVLRGPLLGGYAAGGQTPRVSMELTGEGSLGWRELSYVGATTGPADIPAKLARGIVEIGPTTLQLGEGKLTAAPRLLLNEPSPLVVLDKGPLIDHVRLSPELCRTWLKYVAPLVADATRAEGKFSVDLLGAAVPILEPSKMNVAGAMTIHQAEVGPGPLAQQYLALARELRMLIDRSSGTKPLIDPEKGLLVLPEQRVDFEVVDGRVHHQNMKMTVRDMVITTRGSVGLDQTIELVAEVPIQDQWIKEGSPLVGLRGRSLSVPIHGTLSSPKMDGKVLEQLGRDLVRGAAQGAIENQINKGLQRLFGPAPK